LVLNKTSYPKLHENQGISKRMKIKIKGTGTLTGLPNLTFVSWFLNQ